MTNSPSPSPRWVWPKPCFSYQNHSFYKVFHPKTYPKPYTQYTLNPCFFIASHCYGGGVGGSSSILLPGCSWLLLAASGCFWLLLAAPGCSWLLLAGLLLAAPGCSWLLQAAPGCSSLLLAALSYP